MRREPGTNGRFRFFVTLLALGLVPLRAQGEPARSIVVPDVNGNPVAPLKKKNTRATVFFFITNECPITNAYAPEMNRICAAYAQKKIAFYLVYTDPTVSPAGDRKHYKAYGYRCPALIDSAHKLVRLAGATITPEAAVLGPNKTLLYRGRIDNLYIDFGKNRDHATTHELRDALEAILSGKSVAPSRTKAVGCFIGPLSQESPISASTPESKKS